MPDSDIFLLSAHQPVYLPWLGFFHKIAVADLFIIYDDVPYSRYGWYNRNVISSPNGAIQLVVPIVRNKEGNINHSDVRINNNSNWRKKHWKSIEQNYRKAPFFEQYADDYRKIYDRNWDLLIDLNVEIIKCALSQLGITTKLEMASNCNFEGAKSDRALNMCKKLNADILLFGTLGKDYADVEAFLENRVVPLFQEYEHPKYNQFGRTEFEPYMCVLDLLFNEGPASKSILLSENPSRQDYILTAMEVRSKNSI